MPTYGDLATRIRALLDDQPSAIYDAAFLLPLINSAQATLVSTLMANNVDLLKFRTTVPIFVKAGVTSIGRLPIQYLSNYVRYSDTFTLATPGPASVPSTDWQSYLGATPTRTAGQADPAGGTSGVLWAFATPGSRAYQSQFTFGAASSNVSLNAYSLRGSFWAKTNAAVPAQIILSVGYATGLEPIVYAQLKAETFHVDGEWRRFSVEYGQFDATALSGNTLAMAVQAVGILAGAMDLYLYRGTLSVGSTSPGDVYTNGAYIGELPTHLPLQMVTVDQLWEASVGAQDYEFIQMRGPVQLPIMQQQSHLRLWDQSEGKIRFLGATEDRLIRMDYWGSLADFRTPASLNEDIQIPDAMQALAFLTASLIATSRGQHDLAVRFADLQPEGIRGMAGSEINNLVNVHHKAQQADLVRRQPYFGTVRYPGGGAYGGGGWPWNA